MNARITDHRYLIVASAFVIQAVMVGGLFTYGVFFSYLETDLGWSRTLLSACISLCFIVMGVAAIAAGRFSDRLGPSAVMLIAGVAYGLGFALMYFVAFPWQLFVLFGVLIGAALGAHDVVTLSVVARSFERRRGAMTALVKVGTASGQIIVPLIASASILWLGWRGACLLIGVCAGVIVSVASRGLAPTSSAQAATSAIDGGASISLRDAARGRTFWTLCCTQFAFFPSLVTIPVHLPVHSIDMGMSTAVAASLLSVIGAASIAGRISIGVATDRFGGRIAMMMCLLILSVSVAFLNFAHDSWMLFVFAVGYGLSHGGLFTVVSPTVAEYFGMQAHGTIFGVIVFSGTIGASVGPLLAGSVFDTTGSYAVAFQTLTVLAVLSFCLIASLPSRVLQKVDRAV